jgi:hypothetical protein
MRTEDLAISCHSVMSFSRRETTGVIQSCCNLSVAILTVCGAICEWPWEIFVLPSISDHMNYSCRHGHIELLDITRIKYGVRTPLDPLCALQSTPF